MANINGTIYSDNNTIDFNGLFFQFFGQINGTAFNDYIFADNGDDLVFAGDGDDLVDGWNGNDTLYGEGGNDTLLGYFGNDLLFGGNGDDVLKGEGDDDTLYGSSGNDTLDGGSGWDTADYSALGASITLQAQGILSKGFLGTDNLVGIETIIGAAGFINVIDASGANGTTASISVDLRSNSLTVNNIPVIGNQSFNVQNFIDVVGTSQNDIITGDDLGNYIFAGAGDDSVDGWNGSDLLNGEAGNDVIYGYFGNDTINGGDGNDVMYGESDNDTLNGGEGDDRVFGGEGDDLLYGSNGNDTLNGEGGNDTVDYSFLDADITLQAQGLVSKDFGNLGTDNLVAIETIIADAGFNNTIDASGANGTTASIDVNLTTNSLTVNNIPAIGSQSFNVQNFVNVKGTSQNDTIVGNNAINSLFGDAGNDTIKGGDGNDFIDGWIGNDRLFGDNGNDTMFGYDGNDSINGGNGNDFVSGEGGKDSLNGDAGKDTLNGGAANDIFVFRFGQSTIRAFDSISDYLIGSDKIDILTAGGAATGAPAAFSRAANSAAATLSNVVNGVFTDSNGAIAGNQALGINSAALVVATGMGVSGTYLVINDGIAGFQAAVDTVVNITGYNGSLPNFGAIPVGNFFV